MCLFPASVQLGSNVMRRISSKQSEQTAVSNTCICRREYKNKIKLTRNNNQRRKKMTSFTDTFVRIVLNLFIRGFLPTLDMNRKKTVNARMFVINMQVGLKNIFCNSGWIQSFLFLHQLLVKERLSFYMVFKIIKRFMQLQMATVLLTSWDFNNTENKCPWGRLNGWLTFSFSLPPYSSQRHCQYS